MKEKYVIPRSKSLLSLIIVLLFLISIMPIKAYAATLKIIPSTSLQASTSNMLRFSAKNYTAKWTGVNGKILDGKYAGYKNLCVPIKSKTASFTYKDFLDISFTNIGNINGRQLDAKIHFNSLTVAKRGGSATGERPDNYMSVCYLTEWTMWLGGNMTDGAGYRAAKNVDMTVTIYWHDTGETVNLPFFQCLSDIDAGASYFKEGWEAKSGYSGIFYRYSQCGLSFSGSKASTPSALDYGGNDSLLKAGFYAPTTGGTFRSSFYLGNCATQFIPYSAYTIIENPTKASSGKDINIEGDSISYTIDQNMGKFYVNTFTTFKSFVISDELPEGLTYKSAKVFDGSTDITSKGTVKYDSATRTVSFTMGSSWLDDINNYKGQTLSMKIETEVSKPTAPKKTILNDAVTKIDTLASLKSNEVNDVIAIPYKAVYQYKSGTEGKSLPKEISTTSGAYKVNDDGTYYQGDTVVRKSAPADGTNLKVKDSKGNLEGTWILSWDSESKTVSDRDVIFIGTWRYVPAPRIVLVKKIENNPEYFTQAHGEPTFLFKITGKDSGRNWYKSITFTQEAMEAIKTTGKYQGSNGEQFVLRDGNIYGTCKSIYLPEDDYVVEEIDTLRFNNTLTTARYHGDAPTIIQTSAGETVTVPLKLSTYKQGDTGFNAVYSSVTFDNTKTNWSRFSHSDTIINKLEGGN